MATIIIYGSIGLLVLFTNIIIFALLCMAKKQDKHLENFQPDQQVSLNIMRHMGPGNKRPSCRESGIMSQT